ncbi:hypothetical protein MVES1_003146 [Malassezia vespertilionis]|uniref:F-box domain-containing protein n=1 Tax=Malassezia vespertilionis TaxID=2020962 RepID=A0A2N1J943_9BASI|nr:uncharacterized protein MVES1_003146 [Malassezia vespertilionis]PKI83054.1 hypothetical protein MVES_002986 [Malassezia vespertilionis]WFD07775.1 hypothetical protein MVES1_003146 [Malassezia vespertilionis]
MPFTPAALWVLACLVLAYVRIHMRRGETPPPPPRNPIALPPEIARMIFAHAAADRSAERDGLWRMLVLSHTHFRILAPIAYHTIHVRSSAALHVLRTTLVLRRPKLARYVRCLRLDDCDPSAVGMEQVFLCLSRLASLSLDARACVAVGKIRRIKTGARPTALRVRLGDAAPHLLVDLLTSPLLRDVQTLQISCMPHAVLALADCPLQCLRAVEMTLLAPVESEGALALQRALARLAERKVAVGMVARDTGCVGTIG